MDLTDTPDEVREAGEERPDFDEWDDPETVLRGGSTRERMLDVIIQLRDPAKVSTVADRAGCDTETARDYLAWFAGMGMVREIPGRPVRYERNESYLRWRRVERIRASFSEEEIVRELADVVEAVTEYRERFGAETPDAVSLVDASREGAVVEVWEALSEWKTLERRAALLDAARRAAGSSNRDPGQVDA